MWIANVRSPPDPAPLPLSFIPRPRRRGQIGGVPPRGCYGTVPASLHRGHSPRGGVKGGSRGRLSRLELQQSCGNGDAQEEPSRPIHRCSRCSRRPEESKQGLGLEKPRPWLRRAGKTTSSAAEARDLRWQALLWRARRVLGETSDPWAALAVLGIKANRPGRIGRSQLERSLACNLYRLLTTEQRYSVFRDYRVGGVCSIGSLVYRAFSIAITSATRPSGFRNGNGLPVYL